MEKLTSEKLKQWIEVEESDFYIDKFREKRGIDPDSSVFYTTLWRMVENKELRRMGRGLYHKIKKVNPVSVFSVKREHILPYELGFPRDRNTEMEMDFVNDIVIREGDLILISGLSNFGKTTLCLNFCGENIDKRPVLMGNEYTTWVDENYIPTPRFLNRLEAMDWVDWVDVDGNDKITLLPIRGDYAEHIVKDRINIIDWINIDTGEHYMIGTILESIKKELGRGIAIITIQKAEGATAGRGGQFTKDFADLELLIDKFGDNDVLLTIGKVKEYTKPIIGKTYAYSISKGVKILNFREVKRCTTCHGSGYVKGEKCESCFGNKYVDK